MPGLAGASYICEQMMHTPRIAVYLSLLSPMRINIEIAPMFLAASQLHFCLTTSIASMNMFELPEIAVYNAPPRVYGPPLPDAPPVPAYLNLSVRISMLNAHVFMGDIGYTQVLLRKLRAAREGVCVLNEPPAGAQGDFKEAYVSLNETGWRRPVPPVPSDCVDPAMVAALQVCARWPVRGTSPYAAPR